MKKYILFLIWILFLSNINILSARCDQVFDWWMVRYNYTYNFYDDFISKSNDVYLNTFNIDYINPNFLNTRGIKNPFHWTEELKNNNYKVPANTTMRILEVWTNRLQISSLPQTRTNWTRNSYDFGIEYTTSYDYSNNFPNASDDISHKECVYYSVSWCWDWVIEPSYWEICDPGDPNKIWWGPNWCNTSCKPVNNNQCDQIFDWWKLRYNYAYNFYDEFINWSNTSYLNKFNIDYVNPQFLDNQWILKPFNWSQSIISSSYKLNPNQRMIVLETSPNKLRIAWVPSTPTNWTRNSYDFGIQYTINYDNSNTIDTWDDFSHKECIYYSTSWCWDKIIDSSYWETCDNWNLNWTAWNSCNSSCQLIPGTPWSWLGTTTSRAWEWNVPTNSTSWWNF